MLATIGVLGFFGMIVFLVKAFRARKKQTGLGKKWMKYAGICFVIYIVALMINNAIYPTPKQAITTNSNVATAPKENAPVVNTTKTEEPKPAPTPQQTPQDKLQSNITKAIGDSSNRNGKKVTPLTIDPSGNITVQFKIDDNLTSNLIVVGVQTDITKILKAIKDSGISYTSVNVVGTFSMQDKYGNGSEAPVVKLTYSKATIDKINFDNFLYSDVYSIADEQTFIHPDFQSK